MIPNETKYPEIAAAATDVKEGLAGAKAAGKRAILNFGADWCPDCWALDSCFKERSNAELLARYFVVVKVNVGMKDANLEIARKYGLAVKAIPALAVVEGDGSVVYAEGEKFSNARSQEREALTAFLNKWKT